MLKDKVQKALNKQLNEEFYSSYAYLSMSAYFSTQNLDGMAHWLRLQSQEEYMHAMKIFDYIIQRDGKVNLLKVDPPKTVWKTALDIFQEAYNQERVVTKSIDEIVELAFTEKDHATYAFMQWFVTEQVEEESAALKTLDKVKLVGDSKNGLYLLDKELGQRTAAT